jgi:hypothetical protein
MLTMFSTLEAFNGSRARAVEAEATVILQRLVEVFQARIQDMISIKDPILGGIQGNGGIAIRLDRPREVQASFHWIQTQRRFDRV